MVLNKAKKETNELLCKMIFKQKIPMTRWNLLLKSWNFMKINESLLWRDFFVLEVFQIIIQNEKVLLKLQMTEREKATLSILTG